MQITPVTPETAQDYYTTHAESALDRLINHINKYLLKGEREIVTDSYEWIDYDDIIRNIDINPKDLIKIAIDVYRSVGWDIEYPVEKFFGGGLRKWMIFKPEAKLPTTPKNAVPVKPGFSVAP